MNDIYKLIHALGIKRTYLGYHHLATAIQMVIDDERRFLYIYKWLYADVARVCHTSPACIERNIRTVNIYCWKYGNRELLNRIAGCTLQERPGNSEFIDILSCYVKDQYIHPVHLS